MNTRDKLTEIFKMFPGIGERQARRFVYFLMSRNPSFVQDITKLLTELKKETKQCKECFRFFTENDNNTRANNICENCIDPHTDSSLLVIVEKDSDLESVEKSGTYFGKYFVLGGLVPIVEKNTGRMVRIEALKKRIVSRQKNGKQDDLKEVILAFSLSPQGNHTDHYVRSEIKEILKSANIKLSSLGRGLSTGTELEYSDNDTIKNALKNRQ